jgi:hypothetical protein
VEAIFQAALQAHEWLVVNVATTLGPLLATHAVRPAAARVTLHPADDSRGLDGSPTIDWHLAPLPESSTNTVEVTLASRDQPLVPWTADGSWRAYERMRPLAAPFTGYVWHRSVHEMFGSTPATDLTYSLLFDDLKTLRWVR